MIRSSECGKGSLIEYSVGKFKRFRLSWIETIQMTMRDGAFPGFFM